MITSRRSFIKGLVRVGAIIAFDPHRVVFDMAKGLYLPIPPINIPCQMVPGLDYKIFRGSVPIVFEYSVFATTEQKDICDKIKDKIKGGHF
jgi:hypothetical protein